MMPLLGYPGTGYQVPGTRYQVPGASSILAMYRWQYNEPPESWVSGTSDVLEELLFGGSVLYFEMKYCTEHEIQPGLACIHPLFSPRRREACLVSSFLPYTHIFLLQVIRCAGSCNFL